MRKITKKAYKTIDLQHMAIDVNRYVLNENWLDDYIRLCIAPSEPHQDDSEAQAIAQKQYNHIQTHLNRHVGSFSDYAAKENLRAALKFHYAILSGALREVHEDFNLAEDKKSAIIYKLLEELTACTPGFHNRVNILLESYFLPKTIDEFLHVIRKDIIERVARSISSDVHVINRFFHVAAQNRLGVAAKLDTDPYGTRISDSNIHHLITHAFKQEFQPFSTLFGLKELLISRFDKYYGRNETSQGYTLETFGPGLDAIQILFHENERDYVYLIQDQDDVVRDINWELILKKLWILLNDKGYFNFRSWQDTLSNWFPFFGESQYQTAVDMVRDVFETPETLNENKINTLSCLLSSDVECFAYLKCNPHLTDEIKLAILFEQLAKCYKENPYYDADAFWIFAAENPDLAFAFGQRYLREYPEEFCMLLNGLRTKLLSFVAKQPTTLTLLGSFLQVQFSPLYVFKTIIQDQIFLKFLLETPTVLCDISVKWLQLVQQNLTTDEVYDLFRNQDIHLAKIIEKNPNHKILSFLFNQLQDFHPNQVYLLLMANDTNILQIFLQKNTADVKTLQALLQLIKEKLTSKQIVFLLMANDTNILQMLLQKSTVNAETLQTLLQLIKEKLTSEQIADIIHGMLIKLLNETPFKKNEFAAILKLMEEKLTPEQIIFSIGSDTSSLHFFKTLVSAAPLQFINLYQLFLAQPPSIFKSVFSQSSAIFFREDLQQQFIEYHLLELGLKLSKFQLPKQQRAYDAAKILLDALLLHLETYYINKEKNDWKIHYKILQSDCEKAINVALKTLETEDDWLTFLKNLALCIASVPLLGAPLIINKLCVNKYGCMFFHSKIWNIAKDLQGEIENGIDQDKNDPYGSRFAAC